MVGKTLGHYEILELLGKGGMGEVYLGEDTRLGRKVAIKVLPAEFASDPERLARFEQEARAAAALNHPHIAVVHDVGSEVAEDGSTTHFMVQEFLEGQSLRERLDTGALPLDKALDLAVEVGEALIAARKAGIIHRDLKPDNIFVTEEGHAKVLDFGLAKLTEMTAPTGSSATMSPTMLGTVAGQVMGTAGYMAPEQVNGQEIDHRADLFAFGAVFYEMVTGRRAFSGRTVHQTLDLIMSDNPQPASHIRPDLPPDLDRLLRKCLGKDPDRRYQIADELVVDIRLLQEDVAAGMAGWGASPQPASGPAGTSQVGRLLAASLIGGLVTGLAAWGFMRPTAPTSPQVTRYSIPLPAGQRLTGNMRDQVALSPDGVNLAYVANNQLYLRPLNQLDAEPIVDTEGAEGPFFSPDGQWVGFWQAGQLKKVGANGGAVTPLCRSPDPNAATWGTDDTILFARFDRGILKVAAAGGDPEVLISIPAGAVATIARRPQMLPGGKAVLFTLASGGLYNWDSAAQVVVEDLETRQRKVLVEGATDGRYLPTGHLVYAQGGTVFAVPFDAERLEVTGVAFPVIEGVAQDLRSGVAQFATSDTGTLVYVPGALGGVLRTLVWVDRDSGEEEPLPVEAGSFESPRLSLNDDRIALVVRGANRDIFVYNLGQDHPRRLTFDVAEDESPLWSPDGSRVGWATGRGEVRQTMQRLADQAGEEELLGVVELGHHHLSSWSPDGETMVFDVAGDIWFATVGNGAEPRSFRQTDAWELDGALSPDGEWLAYVSDEDGPSQIYVEAFPDGGLRQQISTGGGSEPLWSPTGREIFYRSGGWMMAVPVGAESGFSSPTPLFEGLYDRLVWNARNYDVTSDGKRFLMLKPVEGEDATEMVVVLNWFEELKQRVPTGGRP